MKTKSSLLLTALFCLLPLNAAQQTSPSGPTPNPQDVPQQQPPGTSNPDVMKQRRPAPDSSQSNSAADQHGQDVPQQEPGTNNPDVGKQRHNDKTGPTGSAGADGQKNSSKKSKSHKKSSGDSNS